MAAQAQLAGTTSVPAAPPCNALRVVVLAAIAAGWEATRELLSCGAPNHLR